ncbi:MAG: FHA domain-containing protein [Lachnospiraceae bacterium]|nr:FHA domain-containing protein [Lachnospiraceae bacterium]
MDFNQDFRQCPNGHWYDSKLSTACPICSAASAAPSGALEDYGATEPIMNSSINIQPAPSFGVESFGTTGSVPGGNGFEAPPAFGVEDFGTTASSAAGNGFPQTSSFGVQNFGTTGSVPGGSGFESYGPTEPIMPGGGFNAAPASGLESYGATEPIMSGSGFNPAPAFGVENFGATGSVPGGNGFESYGPTEPIMPGGGFNPSPAPGIESYGPTEPITNSGFGGFNPGGASIPDFDHNSGIENFDAVKPVVNGSAQPVQPVVGWLVCTEGPDKGRDYRIHEGYNNIGRSQHMDICIAGDPKVSSQKHALIAFDPEEKAFFFSPGEGTNLLKYNGKLLMMPEKIGKGDILTIGDSKFRFVPFVDEDFSWEVSE